MIIRNLPKKKEKVVGTWFYILYNCDTEVWYFGQTKESRKDKRHTDRDYTKVIGEWELEGYKYKTHWIGIEQTGHHLDKKIHRPLRLISGMGHNDSGHGSNEVFRQKKWTEERVVSTCVELVHQVFGNADREAVYRKLYKHQDDFVEKILLYWENTDDEELEFLLFAKCRAGKSTMVLEAIRKSGDKVTLIVARQKSPESSWKGDVLLKNFENFVYINLADKDAKERIEKYLKTDKQIILWSTIQGVKKWKDIPCVVDHIVYDEADVGYNKGQWNDLRKTHPCKVTYVSGTAFDLVYDFDDDNRFCYSYFEEQLDKKLGLTQDRHIPTLHIRTANYDTPEMRKYFGDDPDAFDNMFNTKDGEQVFVHPHLPAQYADDRFRNQKRLRPDEQYISGDIENIMFTVKDCDAAVAFGETMKATRFDPLVATSKQNITPEDINDHLDSDGCKCVITRTANVRGGTYKSIDAVFNLAKGTSKAFYWQFAFRGGSTNKEKWYLYDESPERVFSHFNELLLAAQDVNPELRNYTLTDFINASDFADGYKEWEQEEVEEKLICDVTNIKYTAENFVNGMNKEVLHNIACSTNLASTPTTFIKDVINQNDTNNKSNKQLIPADGFKTKKQEEQEEKEKSKTEKQVREYMKRLPLAVRNAVLDNTFSGSVDEFINSEHYIYITGDSDGVLKEYLEKTDGKEKKRFVHRLNKVFNYIKHAINKNKGSELLNELSHSRQTQQQIPLELLDRMLMDISSEGKLLIGGDPSGLHSFHAIKHGWNSEDISVWENDICHIYSVNQVDSKINIIDGTNDTKSKTSIKSLPMNNFISLANPPFQNSKHNNTTNSLWKPILEDLFQKSRIVNIVLPDIALAPPTFSKYKDYIIKVDTTVKRYFPNVNSGFCTFLIDKNPRDYMEIVTHTGTLTVPIGSLDYIPNNLNEELLSDIEKFLTGTRKWDLTYEYESRKNIFRDDGKYEVLHTPKNGIRRTDIHHPNNDLIRVSVDVSGHPTFHLIHNMGLTQSHFWTEFDTIEEAKEYVEWGNSEEIQTFLRKLKWGGMNSSEIIKKLR